jgi:MoaA/NifB/PqqE/SkfB family radical SAM enzyme
MGKRAAMSRQIIHAITTQKQRIWAGQQFIKLDRFIAKIRGKKRRLKLLNLDIKLADSCNLCCAYCTQFAPLFKDGTFLSLEDYRRDLNRIRELTDQLKFVRFTGGEPLLNADIIKFFDVTRELFPRTEIRMITNGILLPQQSKAFWLACQKHNVHISISEYPIKIDRETIERRKNEYGLDIHYWGGKSDGWTKTGFDLSGGQDAYNNYFDCETSNDCITLKNGKLYTCGLLSVTNTFNDHFGQNLAITERDYIDIYKAQNIYEILDFLRTPMPFCRYCALKSKQDGLKWRASKKALTEWSAN